MFEFAEFSDKIFAIKVKGLEPAISCVPFRENSIDLS